MPPLFLHVYVNRAYSNECVIGNVHHTMLGMVTMEFASTDVALLCVSTTLHCQLQTLPDMSIL